MDTKNMESMRFFMQEAIRMAETTKKRVSPNPRTGAIVVCDGKIIGRGRHEIFGGPHAEVNAIHNAKNNVSGCDMYVTLEPCCHTGKTPPCADKIIASGIKRVVIGMRDPNPLVAGKGVQKLRDAGLELVEDMCHEESLNLNQPFIKMMQSGIPYIVAKMAITLDGYLADKEGISKWISNDAARVLVHEMRSHMDADLIGLGTAIKDDPLLTVRDVEGEHPLRIVYDPKGLLPIKVKLVQGAKDIPTSVICGPQATLQWRDQMRERGVELIECKEIGSENLREGLDLLGKKGVNSILCEGGGHLHSILAELDLIDRVDCVIAPMLIGGGVRMIHIPERLMPDAQKFGSHTWKQIGSDMYFSGILKRYKV
jgi:diaminohydroxyphosphoribosylaminopyrimidine deaminase/5-amino-6-(5-phosphoribosylamino)uracil reductase